MENEACISDVPTLIGDSRRIKQILMNLVKNAIKFTRKGLILIRVFFIFEESKLCIIVQDTGVGIQKSDINHVFTRFGKLHRTAHMNSEGIGLGLTIVK